MPQEYALSRNSTEEFARRVRKNLDFIIQKRNEGADIHEVTQLVTSLLGIIVFPWEDGALRRMGRFALDQLEAEGWPRWEIVLDEKGDTKTLDRLLRHLRNAAAHRRIRFSSDDAEMASVQITFEDALPGSSSPNWRAKINAADLKTFCDRFTEKLVDLVG